MTAAELQNEIFRAMMDYWPDGPPSDSKHAFGLALVDLGVHTLAANQRLDPLECISLSRDVLQFLQDRLFPPDLIDVPPHSHAERN